MQNGPPSRLSNAIAGSMDYRDFIPKNDPQRKEKIEYLEEK